jgi:hypothetical protein
LQDREKRPGVTGSPGTQEQAPGIDLRYVHQTSLL